MQHVFLIKNVENEYHERAVELLKAAVGKLFFWNFIYNFKLV